MKVGGGGETTLMDEIFTIKAVREVLTKGFSNAELGRKTSSNILPLVQEPRRGEYFPPDVGYRYWHKKEIKITPSDFLKGLSLLLDFGESPLHMAISSMARYGSDIISLLILGGVDVNLENKSGNTALYEAVNAGPEKGHEKVVELLLGKDGVDVNKANDDGETPLIMAMQGEKRGVVELLLGKEGVDVESLLGLKANTDGVDVNKAHKNGATALFIASQWGNAKVVELLLGKDGVDVNKANDDGDTPL
jgi:ankyrin repeat protein